MYPRFVEVHEAEDDQSEISVNVDNIINFHVDEDGETIIEVTDGSFYRIAESYDELKALITETGCLIHKADPRLERTPVSWDDLCRMEMIGEPVFNSNTRRWMLLIDSASDGSWIQLVNHAGGQEQWIQHDAQRFPLYRMMKG